MTQTLGELIRERRLGLGFSLGQLAAKMATTVAVVRSWERDEELPPEPSLPHLAEVLELESAAVADLALAAAAVPDLPPLGDPESPTELVQSAAGVAIASVSPSVPPVSPPLQAEVEAADDHAETVPPPPEPVAPSLQPDPQPVPAWSARPQPEASVLVEDPDAPRPFPLKYPQSVPAGVPVEIAETEPNTWNPLRYLYDPEKPWLYWVRAALTVLVLLFLFNLLFDSVGELFDKIGEVIDSIEPSDAVEEDLTDAVTGEA